MSDQKKTHNRFHDVRAERVALAVLNALYRGDVARDDLLLLRVEHADACIALRDDYACDCDRVVVIDKRDVRLEIDVKTTIVTKGAKA